MNQVGDLYGFHYISVGEHTKVEKKKVLLEYKLKAKNAVEMKTYKKKMEPKEVTHAPYFIYLLKSKDCGSFTIPYTISNVSIS